MHWYNVQSTQDLFNLDLEKM